MADDISVDEILDLLKPSYSTPEDPSENDYTPSRRERFFHGTTEQYQPGDTVLPISRLPKEKRAEIESRGRGNHNTDRAWATADPAEAASYGHRTYRVEPVSEQPGLHRSGHLSDRKGLRVVSEEDRLALINSQQWQRNKGYNSFKH